jgi:hypothetical protein
MRKKILKTRYFKNTNRKYGYREEPNSENKYPQTTKTYRIRASDFNIINVNEIQIEYQRGLPP